ncbi:hypothetical protein CYMTET_47035, partial [Cymbomonas tetramitiformis]
ACKHSSPPPFPSALQLRPGAAGVSCDATCTAVGRACTPTYFPFANRCDRLREAFECTSCKVLEDGHSQEGGARLGRSLLGPAVFHNPAYHHIRDGDGSCTVTNSRHASSVPMHHYNDFLTCSL